MLISGFTDEICSSLSGQLQAARELQLDGISLRGVDGVNIGDCNLSYIQEQVLPVCMAYGLRVSSISSPIGKIELFDEDAYALHLKITDRCIDFAQALQCQFVRVFSFYLPDGANFSECRPEVLRKLKGILERFTGTSVVPLLENEKGLYGDTPQRCLELLEAQADCFSLGLIFDPANFVQVGSNPMEAYALLRPYIRYVHIKDASRSTGINVLCGTGDGNIRELLKALSRDGYDGYLTLEPHLVEFDGLLNLEQGDARKVIQSHGAWNPREAFAMQLTALHNLLKETRG